LRGAALSSYGPVSAREGLDRDDLDGDRLAVGRLVRALLADLHADDGRAERALLAVDVEVGAARDLAAAEQELLLVAEDERRDDGAGANRAVGLGRLAGLRVLEDRGQLADASLLLALLVLRRVIPAVLAEVAFLAGSLDALRDLLAADGREVLELRREPVVGL